MGEVLASLESHLSSPRFCEGNHSAGRERFSGSRLPKRMLPGRVPLVCLSIAEPSTLGFLPRR